MQSVKIAHTNTHPLTGDHHCINQQLIQQTRYIILCLTKWKTLADRHIMCSHLTILPHSNHLNCEDTYDTRCIQCLSSSRSQLLSVTIQSLLYQRYMFVLALRLQSVSLSWKILFYFHRIPLLESDGYVLSQYMAHLPTVERLNTQSVHYQMIPLLIIHMCGHICISNTYTYLLFL